MSDNINFPQFSRLPTELRRRVWQLCIPARRTIEIDMPPETDLLSDIPICCCNPGHTTRRNAAVPPFAQACREAREAALEEGGRLLLPSDQDLDRVPNQHANAAFQNPWFWPGRDVVHLNWDPRCSGWYDMDEVPLPFLLRCAREAAGCSVMCRLFGWPPLDHHTAGRRLIPRGRSRRSRVRTEVVEHLGAQSAWSVCLMTVIIHTPSDVVRDSDLFDGGASPIQLVPVSDLQTISAMHRLWESSLNSEQRKTVDEQTTHQFGVLFDHEGLERHVADRQEDLRDLWLLYKYETQWKSDELLSVVQAGAMLSSDSFGVARLRGPAAVEWEGLKFDDFHPWVKAMIDTMPTFHPVVMFRHCALKCYDNTSENLW